MVRQALTVALLAGLLAGCNTSYGYFEEEPDPYAPEPTTAFGALLSMGGMVPQERRPLDYGPRAPLAMPGTSDLPDPETSSAAQQAVNFPVDEDEERFARRDALRGSSRDLETRIKNGGSARTLPGEVQATIDPSQARDGVNERLWDDDNRRLSRDEMRKTHKSPNKVTIMTTEGTPIPRTALIQPPEAYRTPAETAALPDKKDIENSEWVKKQLYRDTDNRPAALQTAPRGR